MRITSCAFLIAACIASAQSPNLSGVWQANLEKSKFAGPPPSKYLVIIQQDGLKIRELIGNIGQRGEQRSSLTYTVDGQPAVTYYRGVPMRSQASWSGGTLTAESRIPGTRPATMNEKYTLSADGNALTIETTTVSNGRTMQQTVLLEKQPDSAGEPLRIPEQVAGARFKNVTVLKEMPASQFMDAMRYFSFSLGVDCEHCHVQNQFPADDKKEKITARTMITMTHAVNQQAFNGKLEVRCFTCHRGDKEPRSTPSI